MDLGRTYGIDLGNPLGFRGASDLPVSLHKIQPRPSFPAQPKRPRGAKCRTSRPLDLRGAHNGRSERPRQANASQRSARLRCYAPSSRNRRNIPLREVEFAQGTLKTRSIFRIPLVWSRRFTQVVTQSRRACAIQELGEYSFGAVLFQARSGLEPFEFRVGEGEKHTVGTTSGGWKKRGALADT